MRLFPAVYVNRLCRRDKLSGGAGFGIKNTRPSDAAPSLKFEGGRGFLRAEGMVSRSGLAYRPRVHESVGMGHTKEMKPVVLLAKSARWE